MALEKSLWGWLAKARPVLADRLHMQRVENSIEGSGDVEGFYTEAMPELAPGGDFVSFWLELKSEERPARPSTPVRFDLRKREKQIEFMRKRYVMGGAAYWLLQVGSYSERMIYLAPGDYGAALAKGVCEGQLAASCCNYGIFNKNSLPADVFKQVLKCHLKRYR